MTQINTTPSYSKNYEHQQDREWHGVDVRVHFDFEADAEVAAVGFVEVLRDGEAVDDITALLTQEALEEIGDDIVEEWRKEYLREDPKRYYRNRAAFDRQWRRDNGAFVR